ncbi:hypothetical protein [Flagellimonas flava]|uniref:hypothetical protein n=1 Tax=Flagellimonas flava TaxID=570519 RepID=UPI003D660DB6
MKKIIFILFMPLMSCHTDSIDGIWIGHYIQLDLDGKKSSHHLNTIMEIDENMVYHWTIIGHEVKEETFEFVRSGNVVIPKSRSHVGFYIISATNDSLVTTMPQMEDFTLVYRKHQAPDTNVVPSLAGKSYKNQETNTNYIFKQDSTFLKNSNISGKWGIKSVHSLDLLTLKIGEGMDIMLLDSIKANKIYLTEFSKELKHIVLNEY